MCDLQWRRHECRMRWWRVEDRISIATRNTLREPFFYRNYPFDTAGLEIDLQHVMLDVRQLSKTSSCGSPLSF
jgi:hypothetical protein